uniref:Uncharacterized protein n=1 Tax=Guillardia theta TaxID=55529 RepID=A0A7S4P9H9_GUITH|mmetsp:Transcript_46203/g.144901  ORF Transcript_46203/g.144901 Transcript_46203/m.144901 type:complete len:100 (+) Transcript_46203:307-606(+)
MSSIKDFTTVISIRPRHAVFVVKRCSSPFTSEDYTLVKFHLRAHHGWMMNLERLQIVEELENNKRMKTYHIIVHINSIIIPIIIPIIISNIIPIIMIQP